jgi:hypothetical protein
MGVIAIRLSAGVKPALFFLPIFFTNTSQDLLCKSMLTLSIFVTISCGRY